MKLTRPVLATLASLALVWLLDTKIGVLPPLARFFDPYAGFWQNAEAKGKLPGGELQFDGLTGEVSVTYDERLVPHIFASNDHDLYFAQGYLTAKDRLWQMDAQTRLASGRLAEVLGPKLVDIDRFNRRMGMVYGAERTLKEMSRHPQLLAMLQAYADGVNARIAELKPKDYPLEFKLLDYAPEKWRILNTALLLKMMSNTLAGGSDEFYMTNVLRKFGPAATRDLFPDKPFVSDPIVPADTRWPFKPVPVNPAPVSPEMARTSIETREREDGIGSNNWVVGGSKTLSGLPILANDPHLDLTLPAIWYQVQLAAPGVNVYGVSIPGAPCVIIGFNQKVAWGVTNVGSDVLDWYSIRFRGKRKTEYAYGDGWRKITEHVEHIRIRGEKTLDDTVRYTHYGPIVYEPGDKPKDIKDYVPEGYALRWIAHDPSADLETFRLLNRAANYADYRNALKWYTAPAQNFIFADVNNDIAITPNGKFPLKWESQGKFLLDGSVPANEWQGFIPREQNPTVKNPPQGYLFSANQFSTAASYPYYLNWEFAINDRAHRINQRLAAMQRATPDSMRRMQTDTYSVFAAKLLPVMLSELDPARLDASQFEAYTGLRKWNYRYDGGSIAASVFDKWQLAMKALTWDEFVDATAGPMRFPNQDRFVKLYMDEPSSPWFDEVATRSVRETRKEVTREAFRLAFKELTKNQGVLSGRWRWGVVKNTRIPHLGGVPGFGTGLLDIGGGKLTIDALSQKNGPSWRMVVALGSPTKGYGVFPGGESGNPGSFYYDDMVDTWATGNLNELVFLSAANEKNPHVIANVKFKK